MKKSVVTSRASAQCATCDQEWKTGDVEGLASKHARYYYHKVWVDVAQQITYDGTRKNGEVTG